ncbi:hypothetical protein Ahy_B04g073288 isoform B [Arachis hypogaea]|uniref:Uncharacterized protein n=1 Tax=Arachis hypogaea TaxID=3818 RepID=A0A444ZQ52_ARAHY|nr:hypothetical protein Ahy_B04g073288 isoform B [Arachis hypogaea]
MAKVIHMGKMVYLLDELYAAVTNSLLVLKLHFKNLVVASLEFCLSCAVLAIIRMTLHDFGLGAGVDEVLSCFVFGILPVTPGPAVYDNVISNGSSSLFGSASSWMKGESKVDGKCNCGMDVILLEFGTATNSGRWVISCPQWKDVVEAFWV